MSDKRTGKKAKRGPQAAVLPDAAALTSKVPPRVIGSPQRATGAPQRSAGRQAK